MIYILHSENLYTFQIANILKTVAKMFEKVLTKVDHDLVTKVKVENFIQLDVI